jgi:N-acyl-D-amino-acid deacylase
MEFDLLIFGGIVADGTGNPLFRADVAVTADTIGLVGELPAGVSVRERIDARGRCVAPGFIDPHSHSDYTVLACPTSDSKVHQGVTTEIIGNCGFSAFPLRGEIREQERGDLEELGIDLDWDDLPSFRARLGVDGHSVNLATLVGTGMVRGSVCGMGNRPAAPDTMAAQVREVERAMEAGAIGLSTGLIYVPSYWADTDEIATLAAAVRNRRGVYASHIRGEGENLLEAVDEACRVGETAGVPVQVSHLKASGYSNWGKVPRAIEQIERSSSETRMVRFDKYPYTASSTGLAVLLPDRVRDGSADDVVARISDPLRRGELIAAAGRALGTADGWDGILIAEARCAQYEPYQGHSIEAAARARDTDPGSLWLDLLIASRCRASMVAFTQSQEETDLVLEHPWGMVGSDASSRTPGGVLGRAHPHPRAYGTFPRFFHRYVTEKGSLTLEEAVRKCTSLPASMFGLEKRGLLKEGYPADIVVFDPDRIRDRATYPKPHQFPAGIDFVLVNGMPVISHGNHTGEKPGRFLTH